MTSIVLGGIAFGAIGFAVAKLVVADAYPEKLYGALIGFVFGLVFTAVGKANDRRKGIG